MIAIRAVDLTVLLELGHKPAQTVTLADNGAVDPHHAELFTVIGGDGVLLLELPRAIQCSA